MFLEMTVQVGLLAEAAVTQWTAERSLSVVDVSDVTLKVRGDTEAATAVLAAIWLLAGVCTQVTGQVRRARERLAAIPARVPVSLPHSGPGHHTSRHAITARDLGRRPEGHDVWKVHTDRQLEVRCARSIVPTTAAFSIFISSS